MRAPHRATSLRALTTRSGDIHTAAGGARSSVSIVADTASKVAYILRGVALLLVALFGALVAPDFAFNFREFDLTGSGDPLADDRTAGTEEPGDDRLLNSDQRRSYRTSGDGARMGMSYGSVPANGTNPARPSYS